MSARFAVCLAQTLKYEGGYVNNPSDHGGATNYGVTQRVYDAWLAKQGRGHNDVKNILQSEVGAIYAQEYWTPACCDALPPPVDCAVFDAAVNSGVSQSVKWLQRALLVTADGVLGPKTLAAAKVCDAVGVTRNMLQEREDFFRMLAARPGQEQFLKGWLRRVDDLRKVCGVT